MERALDSRWIPLAIVAFAYFYVFPYQPRINNPNENVRFYMTAAIVDDGRYDIDAQRARWGWVNDAAVHDGHHYSVKAPGASILAIPGYALYRGLQRAGLELDRPAAVWCCRLTASILPALVWLWFVIGFFRRAVSDPALADAAVFAVALGSPFYGYTMMLASHATSAVAAFGAFMLLIEARRAGAISAPRAACAGALAAGVTWLEYQGLVASVVLTFFALFVLWPIGGLRKLAWFALGASLPTLSTMHFQYRAFGSPFTPGHLALETAGFRAIHSQGFYGLVGIKAEALRMLLIDFGYGLFPITPLLVLGVLGLGAQLREPRTRSAAVCSLGVVALTVLAVSSTTYWRGGWTIGPRYLMVAVPFLALAALDPLAKLARKQPFASRGVAVGLLAAGLIASGLPSAYYPHVPEEITRPLPELFAPLIAAGYAPYNAAALAGVHGTASMLPLALAGAAALLHCLRGQSRNELARALPLACILCGLCLLPLWTRPASEPGVARAVSFVERRWTPAPPVQADR